MEREDLGRWILCRFIRRTGDRRVDPKIHKVSERRSPRRTAVRSFQRGQEKGWEEERMIERQPKAPPLGAGFVTPRRRPSSVSKLESRQPRACPERSEGNP